MNEAFHRLLVCKNLGLILFNLHLELVEIDNIAENILKPIGQCYPGQNLLAIFPEIIGNETFLEDIVRGKVWGLSFGLC